MARRTRKKPLQKSPNRDVRTSPARPVVSKTSVAKTPGVNATVRAGSYPTAGDLVALPQWKEFLQAALRSVLRPAAVAGAVGLAGMSVGCGGEAIGKVQQLFADSPPATTGAPTVVFQPIPNGVSLPPPPVATPTTPYISFTPVPPIANVSNDEPCPLPPRPPTGITRPPVTIGAPNHPPHLAGRIAPVRPNPPPPPPPIAHPNPPQIRGDIAAVIPDPIPVPLGGAPMPTQLSVVTDDSGD